MSRSTRSPARCPSASLGALVIQVQVGQDVGPVVAGTVGQRVSSRSMKTCRLSRRVNASWLASRDLFTRHLTAGTADHHPGENDHPKQTDIGFYGIPRSVWADFRPEAMRQTQATRSSPAPKCQDGNGSPCWAASTKTGISR